MSSNWYYFCEYFFGNFWHFVGLCIICALLGGNFRGFRIFNIIDKDDKKE